jgi:hypothetical protein
MKRNQPSWVLYVFSELAQRPHARVAFSERLPIQPHANLAGTISGIFLALDVCQLAEAGTVCPELERIEHEVRMVRQIGERRLHAKSQSLADRKTFE